MKRLEAIQASPLGYAKRGDLYATARQTFRQVDGVMTPGLWPGGLAGTDDWEPVIPEQSEPPSTDGDGSSRPVEVTLPEAGSLEPGNTSEGDVVAPVVVPAPPVLENSQTSLPSPPVVPKPGRESKRHRSGSR